MSTPRFATSPHFWAAFKSAPMRAIAGFHSPCRLWYLGGMARNATSWPKGNGAGYGGPATGAGAGPGYGTGAGPARAFGAHHQPSALAKIIGKEVAAEAKARIAEKAMELIEAQFQRALDLQHPQGHQAAKDLRDRRMPPERKQELTGADGRRFVICGVPEAEDAAAWQRTHAPTH